MQSELSSEITPSGQPLALHRELRAFANVGAPRFTTGGVSTPETACEVVFGKSIDGLVRLLAPDHHQTLRKAEYAIRGVHIPSTTTSALIEQLLAPILVDEDLAIVRANGWSALSDVKAVNRPGQRNQWRLVLQGMLRPSDDSECPAAATASRVDAKDFPYPALLLWVQLMEAREEGWWELGQLHLRRQSERGSLGATETERLAVAEELLSRMATYWRAAAPSILSKNMVFVEEALRALCDWETLYLTEQFELNALLLLKKGRSPSGNWTQHLMRAYRAQSLAALAMKIPARSHGGQDAPVTEDLLKKWSSGASAQLPPSRLSQILEGLPTTSEKTRLARGFYLARVLSFLCELIRCSLREVALPARDTVQGVLLTRYLEVREAAPPASDASSVT